MRAMLALLLHLGGVGECVRLIRGWSDHGQESGDLQKGQQQKQKTWRSNSKASRQEYALHEMDPRRETKRERRRG